MCQGIFITTPLVPFFGEDYGAGSDGDVLVESSWEDRTWDVALLSLKAKPA
jgi:hypothetical protein